MPETKHSSKLPPARSSKSFWHSEPSALLAGHRSTRNLPAQADIVIVGSGITGASVAHYLLSTSHEKDDQKNGHENDGASVVMLEAREVCWGATGRNGGHCLPVSWGYPDDLSIGRFELANYSSILQTITDLEIPCEFVAQEGVRGIYSASHVERVRAAIQTLHDKAPDLASQLRFIEDRYELRRLRLSSAKAAMVTSTAARLWPYKFVAGVLENLLRQASFRSNRTFNLQTLTTVTSIERVSSTCGSTSRKWLVRTDRGVIAAKKVILATNAYTSVLLPEFEDLIVPCRGQMSALTPPESLSGGQRLEMSYGFLGHDLADYLIQRPNEDGGHLMFGGGRQMGESLGLVDDAVVDENVARYLRTRLIDALDLRDGKGRKMSDELSAVAEWTGIMGYSRDDLPWVGKVPISMLPGRNSADRGIVDGKNEDVDEESGIFLSAGYTGHGMPNAWLCGKAVAEMVVHGKDKAFTDEHERLPDAYRITNARIEQAREVASVAERDWAEMSRGQ